MASPTHLLHVETRRWSDPFCMLKLVCARLADAMTVKCKLDWTWAAAVADNSQLKPQLYYLEHASTKCGMP